MTNLFSEHPALDAYYASIRGHDNWHDVANRAMRHLVNTGLPFSADDVRELVPDDVQPPTPNAYGGLFLSWSKQGLIKRIGGGTSRATKRNGGHRHVWVGANAA